VREADPPRAQREVVKAPDGRLVRRALVEPSEWPDPEDRHRTLKAKVISGWRATDSLRWLARFNASITQDHLLAADVLRETWERWQRAASPALIRLNRTGSGGGHRDGLTDAGAKALRQWRRARAHFSPRAWEMLSDVVLDRGHVTDCGSRVGLPGRTYAVGYLIAVLDDLAWFYRGDIKRRRKRA